MVTNTNIVGTNTTTQTNPTTTQTIVTDPLANIVNRLTQVNTNLATNLDTINAAVNALVTSVDNFANTVVNFEGKIPGIPSIFNANKIQNLIDLLTIVLGQIGRSFFGRSFALFGWGQEALVGLGDDPNGTIEFINLNCQEYNRIQDSGKVICLMH